MSKLEEGVEYRSSQVGSFLGPCNPIRHASIDPTQRRRLPTEPFSPRGLPHVCASILRLYIIFLIPVLYCHDSIPLEFEHLVRRVSKLLERTEQLALSRSVFGPGNRLDLRRRSAHKRFDRLPILSWEQL